MAGGAARGLATVPVIIKDVDDRVALELAIIENVQRADLNPVEEALGYQQLIDQHGYTQNDLATVIGKSRSHVANTLRLLKLPEQVHAMVTEGALSAGHARSLITAENPVAVAERIVRDGLSVRQAEALAQGGRCAGEACPHRTPVEKDADTSALEKMAIRRTRRAGRDQSPAERRRYEDPLFVARPARRYLPPPPQLRPHRNTVARFRITHCFLMSILGPARRGQSTRGGRRRGQSSIARASDGSMMGIPSRTG